MPVGTASAPRRVTNRNKRKTKKPRYSKNLTPFDVKKIAMASAKKVTAMNIETKHFNNTQAQTGFDINGSLYLQTKMVQGTSDSDIIGTKARLTSFYLKYSVFQGDDPFNRVRIIVFQDSEFEFLPPTITEILPNLLTVSVDSMYNPDLVPSRFKVHYDKTHVLDNDDPVHCAYVALKDLHPVEFNGNPVSTPSDAKGHLYILAVSDSIVAPNPGFEYDAMLYYKDA